MSRRVVLLASLALNVALAGVGVWLVKRPAPGGSAAPLLKVITHRPVPGGAAAASISAPPTVVNVPAVFDWSQVASTNLAQYVTNLRAIECPKGVIREIILAVVNEDFARRRHAIYEPVHARFWELMVQPEHFQQGADESIERRSQELRAERRDVLETVLGANWQRGTEPGELAACAYQPILSFLPVEKQRRWSELDESFNQRQQKIYQETRANAAGQKAQLEALSKEREVARCQLLTGAEFQEYTTRTSPRADWAQNLAGFEATEEEYHALNQLRATTPTNQLSRFNAQAQALLGEERFRAFQRGQDPRFAEFFALAGRCQLTMQTVELMYQQRVGAEQQCSLVRSTPALSADERQAMLLAIQWDTRQQLVEVLGETAGEAYLRRQGNWLTAMTKGSQP